MRVPSRITRAVVRVLFIVFVAFVAACPLPVLPIVFVMQNWRPREVAAQVVRVRRSGRRARGPGALPAAGRRP